MKGSTPLGVVNVLFSYYVSWSTVTIFLSRGNIIFLNMEDATTVIAYM